MMDPRTSHMYVCSDQNARYKIRQESLRVKKRMPSLCYFREDMDPINGSLCVRNIWLLRMVWWSQTVKRMMVETLGSRREQTLDSEGEEGRFLLIAHQRLQTRKDCWDGTKCKMKEYERAYNIQRTDRSSIFFFAGDLWNCEQRCQVAISLDNPSDLSNIGGGVSDGESRTDLHYKQKICHQYSTTSSIESYPSSSSSCSFSSFSSSSSSLPSTSWSSGDLVVSPVGK